MGKKRGKKRKGPGNQKGVTWDKLNSVWRTGIRMDGENVWLGAFKEEQDAIAVYKLAEEFMVKDDWNTVRELKAYIKRKRHGL